MSRHADRAQHHLSGELIEAISRQKARKASLRRTRATRHMKVFLHLRKGITPARFKTSLARDIRAGQHKAWDVVRARPLTVRHKGRFKSVVTFRPAPRRIPATCSPPDLVASMTGKDAGFVLRYFVGLVTMKLGSQVEGLYVPIE